MSKEDVTNILKTEDLDGLNHYVNYWAARVGMYSDGKLSKQMQKIAEEVTETAIEIGTQDFDAAKSEFGDILFSTIVGIRMLGSTAEECLRLACIKNNKRIDDGRMVNGSFVKVEDLTTNKE